MAPKMKPFIRAEKHLFLTAPDTEFENFLSELDQLSEREPEILDKIEQDLEKYVRIPQHFDHSNHVTSITDSIVPRS